MEAQEEQGVIGEARILTTDESVRTTDELIETTDELIETTEDVIEGPAVTPTRAIELLREAFGASLDADYLPGKTRFRDVLASRFDLSVLTAEELCDELERAGLLRFVSEADGSGWHVHQEGEEEGRREPSNL